MDLFGPRIWASRRLPRPLLPGYASKPGTGPGSLGVAGEVSLLCQEGAKGGGRPSQVHPQAWPSAPCSRTASDLGLDYYNEDSSMSPLPVGPFSVGGATPVTSWDPTHEPIHAVRRAFSQGFHCDSLAWGPLELDGKHFPPLAHPPTVFDASLQKAYSPTCSPTLGFQGRARPPPTKLAACRPLKHGLQGASLGCGCSSGLSYRDLPLGQPHYDSPAARVRRGTRQAQLPAATLPKARWVGGCWPDFLGRTEAACLGAPHPG